ncbi:unnamed protein product [Urochloa decumbens]|uniref:C2H2-type domain-containing protein n=1 Tax=Urochloa decumbens TaxID=240449 RepID=A0ABC9H8R6_9POAL
MERESNKQQQQQPWRSCGFLQGSSFTWPPRSYPCSFCKREFRSAQALGGHMNVHRRDRARLRHGASSPPPPPPSAPAPAPAAAMIPNLNYPPPPVSLELGIGVVVCSCSTTTLPTTPAAAGGGPEDDHAGLDLELRLGPVSYLA